MGMSEHTFATAITCMDGRIQLPVIQWVMQHAHVDYVDLVTEPGADHALATWQITKLLAIKERVVVSVQRHGSHIVVVVGHYDCAAAPGSEEDHRKQIEQAVKVVQSWNLGVKTAGLWVNDQWQVEPITTH
jgi:carbonic anhydrase